MDNIDIILKIGVIIVIIICMIIASFIGGLFGIILGPLIVLLLYFKFMGKRSEEIEVYKDFDEFNMY